MCAFKNIDEARVFFSNDRFAANNGIVLERITEDGSICSMEIKDDHRNAIGGVMGGAIFTLGDFAFATSTNDDEHSTVALDVTINFTNATKGSKLIATSKRIKDGKTTCVYQVTITDDLGKTVALFTGTGFKIKS